MRKLVYVAIIYFSLFTTQVIGTNSSTSSREVKEHVDLIELNHFHDCLGRHVYDQVIFYEWDPARSLYVVRAWCLIEDREIVNRRPVKRYSDNSYEVVWHDRDQNLLREITSTHYRESWTQIDPERANKKILDERLRTCLIKRSVSKTPSETQTEENQLEEEKSEENNENVELPVIPLVFQLK